MFGYVRSDFQSNTCFYSTQGLIQFIDFVEMFDTFDIAGCLLAYFDIEIDYLVNFGKSELIINSDIEMLT